MRVIAKEREWKLRSGIFAFFALLFILLTACGDNRNNGDEGRLNASQNEDFTAIAETYVYLPSVSHLTEITGHIHSTTIHEGRIYFAYVITESLEDHAEGEVPLTESEVVVGSILPSGELVSRLELPNVGTIIDIARLHITEDGNYAMIFTDTNWEQREISLIYAEFSPHGAIIQRREVLGITPEDITRTFFYLRQALFMDDGYIALFADTGEGQHFQSVVYLLDSQLNLLHRVEADNGSTDAAVPLAQTQDGRLLMADLEYDPVTPFSFILREIDIEKGVFGEVFPLDMDIGANDFVHSLHSAHQGSPFDLLIAGGGNLYGYCLDSGEQNLMINWIESRITVFHGTHINPLTEWQISVLTGGIAHNEESRAEHVLLTRTARADLPEAKVVTLSDFSGFSITPLVREQIALFNLRNHEYRIEVIDYSDREQFALHMITGQGPDIIWGWKWFTDMIAGGFLLDLYPFIDSDPELSRSDFLPNILTLMEMQEGSLPAIHYAFVLSTLFGMEDTVGDIGAWTFTEMRAMVEQAVDSGMQHIIRDMMGGDLHAEAFIWNSLSYSDLNFINLLENTADLENEHFIEILELAARLPHDPTDFESQLSAETTRRMQSGEQFLSEAWIGSVEEFQMYLNVFGEDIAFLGWPGSEGGSSLVRFEFGGLAINAGSENQEVAWDFIRQFLMPGVDFEPEVDISTSFSLRVDEFNQMLEDAVTPRFEMDAAGNPAEIPRMTYSYSGSRGFITDMELYALTEQQAQLLRSLVEDANTTEKSIGRIFGIVSETLPAFLAGDRSAADTARIMQNRIQTFLDERG